MPFGPVHRQGNQPAACSCSSLVSTRLTLGKYSCDQTLLPTGKNKASVFERAARSLPAPAHLFPGKVKINPGHRVGSGYFSTAGKGQAGQWDRTGKTGKEGKKKAGEVLLFAFAVQKHQQMEKGVRPAGRSSLLAEQQDRKLDIHSGVCGVQVGVCDSVILVSAVRVNTGLPGTETDSGHLLPVLPLAEERQALVKKGPAPRWLPGMGHDALGTIP